MLTRNTRLHVVDVPAHPDERPVYAAGAMAAIVAMRFLAKTHPGEFVRITPPAPERDR